MIDDEESPKTPASRLEHARLDPMGLDELAAYREELQVEIIRVEAEIARKQGHRHAADAFFRRSDQG